MNTVRSSAWLRIALGAMLIVVGWLGAPLNYQPAQAATDESPLLPETISAGDFYTCGVQSDGRLACWGYNEYGQATPPAGRFSQVSAGGYYTCGVQSNGIITCWGYGYEPDNQPDIFLPLLFKP